MSISICIISNRNGTPNWPPRKIRPTQLVHRRFARASQNLERELLARFDTLLVTSAADRSRVLALSPTANCVVYPNALPYVERPVRPERNSIVFSGNLEYQPNISAIRYFRASCLAIASEPLPGLNLGNHREEPTRHRKHRARR